MGYRFMGLAALLLFGAGCGDDDGSGGAGAASESGTIQVQISGEDIATEGFAFPEGSEVTIADGWEIELDYVFVTVGRVWLSDNPDVAPGDASATGAEVAEASGPWAVELARGGDVPAAGGEGTAIVLATLADQNKNGGAPFASDRRYAFSYSLVAPTAAATAVNFADDPDAVAAYAEAEAEGYVVYYVGTATFRGVDCEVGDEAYDFTAIPEQVPFKLGFRTPAHYINCQNQENQGDPFPDEEYQRGVAVRSNEAALAQITVHLEHPFYSDVEHEPALYFDQIAAQLVGAPAGEAVTIDHLTAVDVTAFTDGAGADLPWRVCDGGPLPAGSPRAFEVGSIAVGPGLEPDQGLRDYRDYVHYVESTLGHLNGGEGLCYVERQYDSPP